jgi:hypothetical protein
VEWRDVCRVLMEKPEARKPLGIPRRTWEDNIEMDFQKWDGGMDWIDLAQHRHRWLAVVNAVMNFRVT